MAVTLWVVAPGPVAVLTLFWALLAFGGCSAFDVQKITVVAFSALALLEECTHRFALLRSTLLILRAFTAFGKFSTELWSVGGGSPPRRNGPLSSL